MSALVPAIATRTGAQLEQLADFCEWVKEILRAHEKE
jgi:hypothetical protein